MPKLNIAHHKSYHPYKADNIERVRRDEERAAAIEAGDRARVMQADSEARIALLRKKSKKGKSKEEDEAEKALDKQLKGKGRAEQQDGSQDTSVQTAIKVNRPNDDLTSITTKEGHFNFWADVESGRKPTTSQGASKKNADYETEKKAEQDKWDSQITMYLAAPPKTWYDSQDGLNPKERTRTQDQRIERVYKDNEVKRVEDPLATMSAYLKRRDEVKNAQERHRANPWADTPRTLAQDRTPVQPSLLSKRHGRHRSPAVEERPAGPPRPPVPRDVVQQAATREGSERERAKALLAARKKGSSVASTPRSEFGYQTGMYNRAETKEAKGYAAVRWDEDRRRR